MNVFKINIKHTKCIKNTTTSPMTKANNILNTQKADEASDIRPSLNNIAAHCLLLIYKIILETIFGSNPSVCAFACCIKNKINGYDANRMLIVCGSVPS